MISCKRDEEGVDKDNVLEIVDDRFSIEKVVGDYEKVPVRSASNIDDRDDRERADQLRVLLHLSFSSVFFAPATIRSHPPSLRMLTIPKLKERGDFLVDQCLTH